MFSYIFNKSTYKKIWKNSRLSQNSSLTSDCFIGASSWILGFPVVVAIGELSNMLIYALFGTEVYEQTAVSYLKMAVSSPVFFTSALLTILISAPIFEEFLFRGLLQTYFKKYLGTKTAILSAAFFFACFHLNAAQGAGNIPLFFSLFFFGSFLGFIYEKQGSLFASISLHITFNTISTIRIILFPNL